MRKNLVILNYQREIPPFMQTLIRVANAYFEHIKYITPILYNDNRDACQADKLDVYQIPRWKWYWAWVKLPFMLLRPESREQWKLAMQHHKIGLSFIRSLAAYCICGELLKKQVETLLKSKIICPETTTILAAWFSVEAYAMAQLKRKYASFQTVSFAHAFEIDMSRSDLVTYTYNHYKHVYCDKILFISQKMKERYFRYVRQIVPEISDDNACVTYLGCKRKNNMLPIVLRNFNDLHLVSCSCAIDLKRIHLIIETLSLWRLPNLITWTHIGDGELLSQLQQLAHEKLANKVNVKFQFLGKISNEQVHNYYTENRVDLLINVSATEGLPVSIMEAMSYGVPVIATDVGGTSEIVNEKTGWLLSVNFKPTDVLNILEKYCRLSEQERNQYRRQALIMWEQHFNADVNIKKIIDILQH